MILYLAGVGAPDKDIKKFCEERGLEFNRMISFYFHSELKKIIALKKEEANENGQSGAGGAAAGS